jgi:hypothetical protein
MPRKTDLEGGFGVEGLNLQPPPNAPRTMSGMLGR